MRRKLLLCFSFLLTALLLIFSSTATQAATGPARPKPTGHPHVTVSHSSVDPATLQAILQAKLAQLQSQPGPILHQDYVPSKNYPVLFIHGINNSSSVNCNNSSEWGPAKSFLPAQGWTGALVSIQYYSKDTSCDASILTESSHCTGYYDSGSKDGTDNEDVKHVSCEFAWYIWDHYTQYGQNVQVVAHSMGGLITRWALYETPLNKIFPPYLLIQDVVTLGTPHDGAPPAYAFFYCGSCAQGGEIETSSSFMQELIKSGQNPQGSGPGTDWTMLGSKCDIANTLNGDNTEWMDSGHKVLFQSPCYGHGDYMTDTSTSDDASVKYCDYCGTPPVNYASDSSSPHSLKNTYYGLLYPDW